MLAAAVMLAACATPSPKASSARTARQLLGLPPRGLMAVPARWVTLPVGPVELSVPRAWPVHHGGDFLQPGAPCDARLFPRPVVDLGFGRVPLEWCGMEDAQTTRHAAAQRGNGVWLTWRGDGWRPSMFGAHLASQRLVVHGVKVTLWYLSTGPTGSVDAVLHRDGVTISLVLGIGRPELTAARVLSSLRPATPEPMGTLTR